MKKRILFSACVLAACFTACTNDDFQAEQNKNAVVNEAGEVIGADLVSSGMSMTVNNGNATTRVTDEGAWEVNDKSGLAWLRYNRAAITAEQSEAGWYKGTDASYSDHNLYANHLFSYQPDGQWATQGDVYQGAYFTYFPYDRMPEGSKLKVIAPNAAPQTGDFDSEWQNKAFLISAQDFIAQGDVVDFVLDEPFILTPMVNVLGINAAAEEQISTNEYLSKMIITQMNIANGTSGKIFATEATLVPSRLPKAVDTKGVHKDVEDIIKEMDEAVVGAQERNGILTNMKMDASLATEVDKNADFNLSEARKIRAFAFPLGEGANYTSDTQQPSVTITVSSPNGDWTLGKFNINRTATLGDVDETNANMLRWLKMLFNKTVDTANPEYTWVKNIRSNEEDPSLWVRTAMSASLKVKDFTPTTTGIKSEKQWNDYVDLIDALAASGKTFPNNQVVFGLGGDVDFTDAEGIRVPEKVEVVLNTGNYDLVIAANQPWNHKLVTNGVKDSYKSNIVVEKGVTLTVDPEEEVAMDVTSLVNEGIIRAGQKASISTNSTKALDNTNGRVIVEFGAYVYPVVDAKKGVIAYEVETGSKEEVTEIELLVQGGKTTNNQYANVNTLIVKEGATLDLNAKGTTIAGDAGNRYEEEGSDITYSMPVLSKVDIELEGGAVVNSLGGANKNVNNVISLNGGEIRDIEPLGNITVKGGELVVSSDASVYVPLKDLELTHGAYVEVNGGTMIANTDVWVSKVILSKGSILTENESYFYIPSEDCLEKTPGTNFTPGLRYTNGTSAAAVKATFNALRADSSAKDAINGGETSFLNAMNSYVKSQVEAGSFDSSTTGSGYVGFYNDFNKWLKSIDYAALEAGKDEITADHLDLFTKVTGYEFEWSSTVL